MRKPIRISACASVALVAYWWLLAQPSFAANWSVAPTNSLALDTSASGLTVNEMSGIAYLGPSPVVGKHRFQTVQDDGSGVVTFDAAFDLLGNLISAEAVSELQLSVSLDFEGIAYVDDSLFLSEENTPGVREFDSLSGEQTQSVAIPALFSNRVGNRGFESLAYDPQTSTLWTANEEALTIDGPLATSSAGTTVRLLELEVSSDTVTADEQYAYEVESIHGIAIGGARSGLAELVSLPDGTLMALERSAAVATPFILHRLYEIDFAGATDVSKPAFNTGLEGMSYTAVGKELVWSGGIAGGGDNMEGLAVGPRLPNGDWVLLGVVDNGGSGANTIAAFGAGPTTPITFDPDNADFDADGQVDGDDLLAWQRGAGVTTLAGSDHGDANHDGAVDGSDLAIWQNQYGSSPATQAVSAIPESTSVVLLMVSLSTWLASRRSPK